MTPNPTNPEPPFQAEPISPDILAWASQALDVKDFLDQVRQIELIEGQLDAGLLKISMFIETNSTLHSLETNR